jgi:hypothetical protein
MRTNRVIGRLPGTEHEADLELWPGYINLLTCLGMGSRTQIAGCSRRIYTYRPLFREASTYVFTAVPGQRRQASELKTILAIVVSNFYSVGYLGC